MCVLWDRFESFLGFIHMYPSGLHSSEGLLWLMSLLSPELSFPMCGLRGECVVPFYFCVLRPVLLLASCIVCDLFWGALFVDQRVAPMVT